MELTYGFTPSKLEYVEKEKKYKINLVFFEVGEEYKEENKIILTFDEEGIFIEAEPQIIQSLTNKTMEETKKEHMAAALNCKEEIKETLECLIRPKNKEEILFEDELYDEDAKCVLYKLNLDGLTYIYTKELEESCENELECLYTDIESSTSMMKLRNVPSLKEIKTYIENHPKVKK